MNVGSWAWPAGRGHSRASATLNGCVWSCTGVLEICCGSLGKERIDHVYVKRHAQEGGLDRRSYRYRPLVEVRLQVHALWREERAIVDNGLVRVARIGRSLLVRHPLCGKDWAMVDIGLSRAIGGGGSPLALHGYLGVDPRRVRPWVGTKLREISGSWIWRMGGQGLLHHGYAICTLGRELKRDLEAVRWRCRRRRRQGMIERGLRGDAGCVCGLNWTTPSICVVHVVPLCLWDLGRTCHRRRMLRMSDPRRRSRGKLSRYGGGASLRRRGLASGGEARRGPALSLKLV